MTKILLIFAILGIYLSSVNADCNCNADSITSICFCDNLQDGDLPGALASYSGHYDELTIEHSSLTVIKANSFPGLSFDSVKFGRYLDNLETIEHGFLQGSESAVINLRVEEGMKLRDFPFHDMVKFSKLEFLYIFNTAIEVIPKNIEWPASVTHIWITGCPRLRSIEPHAFSSATNLQYLTIEYVAVVCEVKSNGFHTKSSTATTLTMKPLNHNGYIKFEANAFGNIDGSHLWHHIVLGDSQFNIDFNEGAFRLLINAYFDKKHPFDQVVASVDEWTCHDCDLAWLYKDAQNFGFDEYKYLASVSCPYVGNILETDDAEFISKMNNCPDTPMPWPEDNYCEDVTDPMQSVNVDPNDCHCYYDCAGGLVQGHECCASGLAFNPNTLTCDWINNVENCE